MKIWSHPKLHTSMNQAHPQIKLRTTFKLFCKQTMKNDDSNNKNTKDQRHKENHNITKCIFAPPPLQKIEETEKQIKWSELYNTSSNRTGNDKLIIVISIPSKVCWSITNNECTSISSPYMCSPVMLVPVETIFELLLLEDEEAWVLALIREGAVDEPSCTSIRIEITPKVWEVSW